MKKTAPLLIAILFTALLQAQQPFTKDQQAVQQTVINMFDALSNRDSVKLKLYCANDIALYEYGLAWNMDSLITRAITLNTAIDFKRSNTIDFITTTVNNKTAWAAYHLHSEIIKDAKHSTIEWIETVILVKEKNSWKIKVLHSTLIKRT